MAKYSDRILKIASYVGRGETVADIGPDHGYLAEWLIRNGISPRVIMSDVAEGPLLIARRNAERYLRDASQADFRLGDGLAPLERGEVDTVVIAGMGGESIIEMLGADPDKTRSFGKYILQPRTKVGLLREWLEGRYDIMYEGSAVERGRDCEIIVMKGRV
jgi:tRNA (adenine22-N1)-methyltransferase